MYSPGVLSANEGAWHDETQPTHEWRAIAISKLIAHKFFGIDASILVTCARRRQNRLIDLKVNQRAGRCSLALPNVREPR